MQPIKIAIPEPCHENWGNMNSTEQGRFCNSCAKEVIDFSVMDDGEMYMTLQKAMQNNKSVCGRVQTNQLQRPILSTTQKIKTQVAWYWKYITALFLFSNEAKTFAQKKAPICTSTNTTPNRDKILGKMISTQQVQHIIGDTLITTTQNLTKIKGTIIDEKGESIPFATIQIKGKKLGIRSNIDGNYTINVDKDSDIVIISAVGYNTREYVLKNNTNFNFTILKIEDVERTEIMLAGMVSVSNYQEPISHIIVGNVIDSVTKTVIQNATVNIKELNSNNNTSNKSDKKGNFKLTKLYDYINYEVTISATGFHTKTVQIKGADFKKKRLKYIVQLVRDVDIRNYLFGEIYPEQRILSKVMPMGDIELIGKVINEIGNPITNANISIKGKYEHFTSDSLGNFNVKLKSNNDILQISYLNNKKEFDLNNHTGNEFVLETIKKENEVVVVGNQGKRIVCTTIMGSVSSIVKTDTILDKLKSAFTITKEIKILQPNKITNLKIYPNPAPILSLTYVDINNEDAYAIHIINESGIVLQKELVNNNTKNKKIALRLSNAVIAGFYIVEVTNSKGEIISNGKLIVQ
jgi:CarboxypepD_reg-like domain/Carboxypeptidase regulatory-like domain